MDGSTFAFLAAYGHTVVSILRTFRPNGPQPNRLVKLLDKHWSVSESKHNGLVNWPGSQAGAMHFTAMLTVISLFLLLKAAHLSETIPLIAADNLKVSTPKLAEF